MIPAAPDQPPSPASARSSSPHYCLWLALTLLFVLLILVNWMVNQVLRGDAVTYWRVQEFLFGLAGGVLVVIGVRVLVRAAFKKPRSLRMLAEGLYLFTMGSSFGFIVFIPLLSGDQINLIGSVGFLAIVLFGVLTIGFRRAQQPE